MSNIALLLVLGAACCHAVWNVLVKRINGGPELIWLFSLGSAILYLPLAAWIILVQRPEFTLAQMAFIAGSAVLHLAYFWLLQTGYRRGELSIVYPTARATGPLLSTGFAIVLLNETLSAQMALGALLIIGGVFMLTSGSKRNADQLSISLLFGLGTGALIGSYTTWDAYAVSSLMIPPLLLDYASSLGRCVVLAPLAWKRRQKVLAHIKTHFLGVVGISLFNPMAYILVLVALTHAPVAYVAPTREVSVVLTVLAGSILLKEGHLRHRLGWAVVILCGIGLLVTG